MRGGGGASKDEPKHKVTRVAWSPSRGGREGEQDIKQRHIRDYMYVYMPVQSRVAAGFSVL